MIGVRTCIRTYTDIILDFFYEYNSSGVVLFGVVCLTSDSRGVVYLQKIAQYMHTLMTPLLSIFLFSYFHYSNLPLTYPLHKNDSSSL